jgi:hypothetical protein
MTSQKCNTLDRKLLGMNEEEVGRHTGQSEFLLVERQEDCC